MTDRELLQMALQQLNVAKQELDMYATHLSERKIHRPFLDKTIAALKDRLNPSSRGHTP